MPTLIFFNASIYLFLLYIFSCRFAFLGYIIFMFDFAYIKKGAKGKKSREYCFIFLYQFPVEKGGKGDN